MKDMNPIAARVATEIRLQDAWPPKSDLPPTFTQRRGGVGVQFSDFLEPTQFIAAPLF